MDKVSLDRIETLHPLYRTLFYEFYKEIDGIVKINGFWRVVQGYRTFAEQDELYAQGRTKSGIIVTKAKGGQSLHNYGLAVDIMGILNNKELINPTNEVVKISKKYNLEWGGEWTTKDMPHFQIKGYKWQDLIKKPLTIDGKYPEL